MSATGLEESTGTTRHVHAMSGALKGALHVELDHDL